MEGNTLPQQDRLSGPSCRLGREASAYPIVLRKGHICLNIDGRLWERLGGFGTKPVRKTSWFEELSNKERSEKERSYLQLLPEHERAWLERNKFFPTSFVLYQLASKRLSERANFLSDGHEYVKLQGINGDATAAFTLEQAGFSACSGGGSDGYIFSET